MKSINRMTFPIVLMLASLLTVSGQLPSDSPQEEPVVVSTNLVTVNVIVTDKKGKYVRGLESQQFSIYDENAKQKIAHFAVGSAPVSIGIVYEVRSTSSGQVSASLSALRQFVATLGEHDTFFFSAYSPEGSVTAEFIPSAKQLTEHLSSVKPGGPSALYDAIYSATGRLRQSRNLKRALLIISDGEDNNSEHSYNQLRDRLREFDVQIYTIRIAGLAMVPFTPYRRWVFDDVTRQTGPRSFPLYAEADKGSAVLGEMARVSGGTTYTPEGTNEPELTGICTQIAQELRAQYTLGFYPNDLTSKKWHRIKVRVNTSESSSKFSLSYRKGYQLASVKGVR